MRFVDFEGLIAIFIPSSMLSSTVASSCIWARWVSFPILSISCKSESALVTIVTSYSITSLAVRSPAFSDSLNKFSAAPWNLSFSKS